MDYRRLGRTDIEVSRIAMGCWAIADEANWGVQSEGDAVEAVRTALEVGINFFDTAELYGNGLSEQLLGKALRERREEAVIASKVGPDHLAGADLQSACERSLRHLNTDWIDLYQVHWPSAEVPMAETTAALERLREQGKIRAIGISNFGPLDQSEFLGLGRCESNQLPYSLLWRAIEFGLLDECAANEISVLPYCPLAQGLLTGKFASVDEVPQPRRRSRHFSGEQELSRHGERGCEELTFATIAKIKDITERLGEPMHKVSLAWLLSQPGVASVPVGARNAEQIRRNAAAVELDLSGDALAELNLATEALKQVLGGNADMWQSESRIR